MTQEWIREKIKEAHENAIEKGFYDCPDCKGDCNIPIIKDGFIIDYERCDCNDTETPGINQNKNIGELLMLIVSELGEALEAHRTGYFACGIESIKDIPDGELNYTKFYVKNIKDTFEDELACVFIRIFDLCGYLKIDIAPYVNISYPSTVDKNVGQALFFVTAELTEFYRKKDSASGIFSLNGALSRLLNMCHKSHMNIPIEKHIEARLKYDKFNKENEGN